MRLAFPAVNFSWGEAGDFYRCLDDEYEKAVGSVTLSQMVDAVPAIGSKYGTKIEEIHLRLRDIAKSGLCTILDPPGHGVNMHVVCGREVWSVTRSSQANMAYLGGHFFSEYAVDCELGCSLPEAREAFDT